LLNVAVDSKGGHARNGPINVVSDARVFKYLINESVAKRARLVARLMGGNNSEQYIERPKRTGG
jgi:hypothetical protein